MAFFKGIGNAFGTVAGVVSAPFDGGKLMNESAAATAKHFTTVGTDVADGFSKDGAVTTFVENIPVAGHIASGVHAIAGNESHAKRAAAKSTNATVATAAVVGTGALVAETGGGAAVVIAAGAAAGAAGAAAGGGVQVAIEATYTDKDVKVVGQEQTNKTPGQWVGEVALGGVLGGVAGGVGAGVGAAAATPVGQSASRGVAQSAVKNIGPKALVGIATPGVAEQAAKSAATMSVNKVANTVAGLGIKKGAAALTAA